MLDNALVNLQSPTIGLYLIGITTLALFLIPAPESWLTSLKRGGYKLLFTKSVLNVVYWFAVLSLIKEEQGVVAFVIVTLLRPTLAYTLGSIILKDGFADKRAFLLGAAMTITGVIWFSLSNQTMRLFESANMIAFVVVISQIVGDVIAAAHRRQLTIDSVNQGRTVYLFTFPFAVLWVLVSGTGFNVPTTNECIALAYIAVVPLALGYAFLNKAVDVIGIPLVTLISDLRPPFVIILGLTGWEWFAINMDNYSASQYIAVLFALIGVSIATLFGKGHAGSK